MDLYDAASYHALVLRTEGKSDKTAHNYLAYEKRFLAFLDARNQPATQLPGLMYAEAFQDGERVGRRLVGDHASDEERAAWKRSPLWARIVSDQGRHPLEDPSLINRAKVRPGSLTGAGGGEAADTVQRYRSGTSLHRLLWEEWNSAENTMVLQQIGVYSPRHAERRHAILNRLTSRLRRAGLTPGKPPADWWKAPPED